MTKDEGSSTIFGMCIGSILATILWVAVMVIDQTPNSQIKRSENIFLNSKVYKCIELKIKEPGQ